jgi:predicted alpha/beta-hydrolase family hydrolase
MTSHAAASEGLPGVLGLVFFAFPLHPAARPGTSRADHLEMVDIPMLFLQGTRDTLSEVELIKPVVGKLGDRATLHLIEEADHSFHVLKRSGRTDDEVLREVAATVSKWTSKVIDGRR